MVGLLEILFRGIFHAVFEVLFEALGRLWIERLFGYGDTPVRIMSSGEIPEVGRRLEEHLESSDGGWRQRREGGLSGEVVEPGEALLAAGDRWRVVVEKNNGVRVWGPVFDGELEEARDGCLLRGRYRLGWPGKCLAVLAGVALLAIPAVLLGKFYAIGGGLAAGFVVLVVWARFGVRRGRSRDIGDLEQRLREIVETE